MLLYMPGGCQEFVAVMSAWANKSDRDSFVETSIQSRRALVEALVAAAKPPLSPRCEAGGELSPGRSMPAAALFVAEKSRPSPARSVTGTARVKPATASFPARKNSQASSRMLRGSLKHSILSRRDKDVDTAETGAVQVSKQKDAGSATAGASSGVSQGVAPGRNPTVRNIWHHRVHGVPNLRLRTTRQSANEPFTHCPLGVALG